MLETSIDELTLVLQAPVEVKEKLKDESDWQKQANLIIIEFSYLADLSNIFGNQQVELNVPQGYTDGYTFGEHSFYFCVAYSLENYSMGVIVKFSGQALASYLEKSNQEVYSFLRKIKSKKYTFRLTRCDLDCDFENVHFSPTTIFNSLKRGTVQPFYKKETAGKTILVKKNCKLQGFAVEKEIPTCYLGAVSSDSQLRIYDKKLEQIQKKGSKLDYFLQFDSVVRFELVLKHELAHNFTRKLLKIHSEQELNDLILSVFLQKFYFKRTKTDKPVIYTKMMINALKKQQSHLQGHLNRDHSLPLLFDYLLDGSGTIPTLYKIYALWGESDLDQALGYIKSYLINWKVNAGCELWLKNHNSDTKDSYDGFKKMLEDTKKF